MRPHGDLPPPAPGNTKKAAGGSRLAVWDGPAARGAPRRGRRRRGTHRSVPAQPLGAGRGRQRPPPAAITADNSPRARSCRGRAEKGGGGGRSPALQSSRCSTASLGRTARAGPTPLFASSPPRRGRPALLLRTASPSSPRDPPKSRGPPGPFSSPCHGGVLRGPAAPPDVARPPRAHLP